MIAWQVLEIATLSFQRRPEVAMMALVSGETCTVLTRAASRVPMTFRTSCDIRARGRKGH